MNRNHRRSIAQQKLRTNTAEGIEKTVHEALRLAEKEKWHEADALCLRVLNAMPNNPDVWFFRGQLAFNRGLLHDAANYIAKAIAQNPEKTDYLGFAAHVCQRGGNIGEAITYAQTLFEQTQNPQHLLHLANIYLESNNLAQAKPLYEHLREHYADWWQPPYNLGLIAMALGNHHEALSLFEHAITLAPSVAEPTLRAMEVLGSLGDDARAEQLLWTFIERPAGHSPENINVFQKLSEHLLYGSNPRYAQAESVLDKAEAIAPGTAWILGGKGWSAAKKGDFENTLKHFHQALRLEPQNVDLWNKYLHALGEFRFHGLPASMDLHLSLALSMPRLDQVRLFQVLNMVLPLFPEVEELFQAIDKGNPVDIHSDTFKNFISRPLFIQALQGVLLASSAYETLLTPIRAALLKAAAAGEKMPEDSSAFCLGLAQQCAMNEYIYTETATETEEIEALKQRLDTWPTDRPLDARLVAVYAAYRPLDSLAIATRLIKEAKKKTINRTFNALVQEQVIEPQIEAGLKPSISSLHTVANDVSRLVQNQYEENPYPRWHDVGRSQPMTINDRLRLMFPWMPAQGLNEKQKPRILIAGCGTGRQAIMAAEIHPHAEVVAVDLSRASLAYALRKQKERNIRNIQFLQGDILKLKEGLGGEFDLIECSGVLHHMDDPMAGWQVLRQLLAPTGFMNIALYSERARQGVVAGRAFIAEHGFPSTPDGIRAARLAMAALPKDHPCTNVMGFQDFFTMSMCRDLLFHVQEHRFTIPKLKAALETLSLEFLGFFFYNHKPVLTDYHQHFPNDPDATNLECWEEYEQRFPDTFRAMYQFFCRPKG